MFGNLWSRIKAAGFGRAFRREPAPGPLRVRVEILDARHRRHRAAGLSRAAIISSTFRGDAPHGGARRSSSCATAASRHRKRSRKGTRITELADRLGFVVLLPRQKDEANPWRCWNWFDKRTMNGQRRSGDRGGADPPRAARVPRRSQARSRRRHVGRRVRWRPSSACVFRDWSLPSPSIRASPAARHRRR